MKLKLIITTAFLTFFISRSTAQELTMFQPFLKTQFYQDDTRISKADFFDLMRKDQEALGLWKKSNTHLYLGVIALNVSVLTLAITGWGDNDEFNDGVLVGVILSSVGSLYFFDRARVLRKKSILSYNANLDKTTMIEYGVVPHGLGLVMRF